MRPKQMSQNNIRETWMLHSRKSSVEPIFKCTAALNVFAPFNSSINLLRVHGLYASVDLSELNWDFGQSSVSILLSILCHFAEVYNAKIYFICTVLSSVNSIRTEFHVSVDTLVGFVSFQENYNFTLSQYDLYLFNILESKIKLL